MYRYAEVIAAMKKEMDYPNEEQIKVYLFKPEPLYFVVCVPVQRVLDRSGAYGRWTNFFYQNLTLLELEQRTDVAFGETLEDVCLDFELKAEPTKSRELVVDWKYQSEKVFFKEIANDLHRCFQVLAYPKEPVYQEILSVSKLIVRFRHRFYELFLLPFGQAFNSNSFVHPKNGFVKNVVKRSKSSKKTSCSKYRDKGLDCLNQVQCVERCFNRRFVAEHKSISSYSTVIDKAHFSASEWSSSLINESHRKQQSENVSFHRAIRAECEREFSEVDCSEEFFTVNPSDGSENRYLNRKIDLYYDVNSSIEDEVSWYSLVLDLINIQCILFGLTVLKTLLIAYRFIQAKTKMRSNKIALFLRLASFSLPHLLHRLQQGHSRGNGALRLLQC